MTILIIFLFTTVANFSQTITKLVNGVSAKIQNSTINNLSWTIRETVIGLMNSESVQLGYGYYIAMDFKSFNGKDGSENFGIKVYPNPT